jgi:hypothetical protein
MAVKRLELSCLFCVCAALAWQALLNAYLIIKESVSSDSELLAALATVGLDSGADAVFAGPTL